MENIEEGLRPGYDTIVVAVTDDFIPEKSKDAENKEEEEDMPFSTKETGIPWSEKTCCQRVVFVLSVVVRLVLVLAMLYLFICSLDILQAAFQLLGGRAAGQALSNSDLVNNPVSGLMIGVLVTVLVQSSSTSTSIIVSMVASQLLSVRQAIPFIMGANIGTSVTSTIVAFTQSADRETFRRSFSGATVHDMFNWSAVIILLPIEAASGMLYHMTKAMVSNLPTSGGEDQQFLKVITKPLTERIISLDKSVITAIAENTDKKKFPMIKYYCKANTTSHEICFGTDDDYQGFYGDISAQTFTTDLKLTNGSTISCPVLFSWNDIDNFTSTKCTHLFTGSGLPDAAMSEVIVGIILLVTSLFVMVVCLLILVKLLSSLLQGPMAKVVYKFINADFPGYASGLTGYLVMLVGAGMTILVQSSSVFTSAVTPLVGLGVITLERVYPLTLGSNIGTTMTSILAALTADADRIRDTMQIALCHLCFNIIGILIFYPVPIMRRAPISLARKLGATTAKYRWFAVAYLIMVFFVFPGIIMGLSLAGLWVLVGVGVPILLIIILIVITNCCQTRCPNRLPSCLQNWSCLPKAFRSFQPYDRVITYCCASQVCQKLCGCCSKGDTSAASEVLEVNTKTAAATPDLNGKIAIISEFSTTNGDIADNGFCNGGYQYESIKL